MFQHIKSDDRGKSTLDWLDSNHTFSFGSYYNPDRMGYSVLRVMNDDTVHPNGGFPTHSHQNMEIVSYVLDGALKHKDSIGNSSIIKAGDVQRMSAGKGVTHSEFNASDEIPVHFLQIWIETNKQDINPEYEQQTFSDKTKNGEFILAVSQTGAEGSLKIHQDIAMYLARVEGFTTAEHILKTDRCVWLQIVKGNVSCNDVRMSEGDGAAISEVDAITFGDTNDAEFILIDLPARM
jgi:quercetin 2,3-dioxygenase